MKNELKGRLIKDCVIAGIAWIVLGVVFGSSMGIFGAVLMGMLCAGVPFGWRWLSNVFTATSLVTIAIKFLLSVMLGWIALPVVIIKDIIAYKTAE